MTQMTDVAAPTITRTRRRARVRSIPEWCALGYLLLILAITVLVPVLPLPDPNTQHLINTLDAPSGEHWLGTDELGRDLLSRLLWAIHTSTLAAATAVVVAFAIGLPLGLLAGYRGGWIDQVLGRIADAVLIVPALILLLAAQTALDTGIEGQMVVLGVVFAPRVLRVIRTETIPLAHAPFVVAGRMSGLSHGRILRRYLMPGVRTQFVVQFTYLLSLSFVVEAGISFLGIGVQPPDASLGTMLTGASTLLSYRPWVVVIPALVLTLLIVSLNVVGDAMNKRAEEK
ncbi:ABC transporter permease [Gordonia sp. CPCC 206044]|uniref:ABC transporter permease n=1 Tax=Gordonia sp. CPCC 206044 TaxID=3140793 RepID=UPI003AF3AF1F